jgi:hypothetical protein
MRVDDPVGDQEHLDQYSVFFLREVDLHVLSAQQQHAGTPSPLLLVRFLPLNYQTTSTSNARSNRTPQEC